MEKLFELNFFQGWKVSFHHATAAEREILISWNCRRRKMQEQCKFHLIKSFRSVEKFIVFALSKYKKVSLLSLSLCCRYLRKKKKLRANSISTQIKVCKKKSSRAQKKPSTTINIRWEQVNDRFAIFSSLHVSAFVFGINFLFPINNSSKNKRIISTTV